MRRAILPLSLALGFAVAAGAQEHVHEAAETLGTVSFETSCAAEAQVKFNRAVALLHSFEFAPAIAGFEDTAKTDPSCGIAFWGEALASWSNPFAPGKKGPLQIESGQKAVARAQAAGTTTAREGAYVAAVAELFRDPEHRDQQTRLVAYRDAMAALAARYPQDMEAQIFYALSLAQAVPPTDKTYADLLKAGAILEPLFATHPDHPGLAHYIIHAYDVPALASHAVDAARRYAKIAPSAPHALHMPSHTFTRLGYWQDSIETNIASAAAAKRDGATAEELHATDYEVYAYLQTGQDTAARRLVDSLPEIATRFNPDAVGSAAPGMAGVFALAAIPARWALERQAWPEAARLEAHASRYPFTEAMTWFARGLGAARTRDAASARASVAALDEIHGRLASAGENYWAGQVEIQKRGVAAWLALAEGHREDALTGMRAAAELEDATEKGAVTPGPIAPARELLGQMLLELHDPAQALEQFRATLKKEPDRFRALVGAAQAATQAGDRAGAAEHYARLLVVCAHADDPGRPELAEAHRSAAGLEIVVDASHVGAKIDRNLFGQFAEHLGHGVYEGVWVGPDSAIPNTRGIRNDVVAALKALHVPNVRWPGGCFADEYHWRNGLGPAATRPATLNPNWGGVIEPNTFGTHEFMDFVDQIGSEAYLSINVGSGTPQEAADWLEYLTTAQPTTLAKQRAANGHPAPYKVAYLGLGNESWACGGNMTPEYYASQMKVYSRFVRNFNPAQQEKAHMLKIAVGPGGGEARWSEWTDTIMKAYQSHEWSWDIDGLSLHSYTVVRWPPAFKSSGFGEAEYAQILKSTLEMEALVATHAALMDKYDAEKKVALVVDEWGTWYAPLPGTDPGFLVQHNSVRDALVAALNLNIFARHADRVRMANIAQMVNVLQAMIVTDKERMLLTPTYHVFKMYVPFQDATFVPIEFDAGRYTEGAITLPRVDAIAAKDAAGTLWLALTNLDPKRPIEITARLSGLVARSATGETLTAPAVDSVNTFEAPNTVAPRPVSAKVAGDRVTVSLEPKSVTVLAVRP